MSLAAWVNGGRARARLPSPTSEGPTCAWWVPIVVFAIAFALMLSGCNTLSGLPPETVNSLANAGGGCVKVSGVWGTGIVIVGNADKGVIRNGELVVAGDCGGISIKETKPLQTK